MISSEQVPVPDSEGHITVKIGDSGPQQVETTSGGQSERARSIIYAT